MKVFSIKKYSLYLYSPGPGTGDDNIILSDILFSLPNEYCGVFLLLRSNSLGIL